MESTGYSEAVTNGIRIIVKSFYISEQSEPTEDHYFFAYRVQIRNEGEQTAQLMARYWMITDGNGQKHEVSGPGVIGEQPVLHPGEHFVYSSFCPLQTPVGSMEGTYQMICENQQTFEAQIAQFTLAMPTSVQ
jgi:ApaG protein